MTQGFALGFGYFAPLGLGVTMPELIVDRPGRDAAVLLIGRYLNDEISLDDYFQSLEGFCRNSTDELLQILRMEFYLNDDIAEPGRWMDKHTWDYLQRFQLLLHTDAFIESTGSSCEFDWRDQLALAFAAILAITGMFCVGAIYSYYPTLGILSYLVCAAIVFFLRRTATQLNPIEPKDTITPFSSIMEIRAALKKCPQFRKQRFGKTTVLDLNKIVGEITSSSNLALYIVCSPALAPVLILVFFMGASAFNEPKLPSHRLVNL